MIPIRKYAFVPIPNCPLADAGTVSSVDLAMIMLRWPAAKPYINLPRQRVGTDKYCVNAAPMNATSYIIKADLRLPIVIVFPPSKLPSVRPMIPALVIIVL